MRLANFCFVAVPVWESFDLPVCHLLGGLVDLGIHQSKPRYTT